MDNEKALPFMPEWAPPRKAFLTINEIFEIRNRDRAAEGLPPWTRTIRTSGKALCGHW
jgi:hypothetical protein